MTRILLTITLFLLLAAWAVPVFAGKVLAEVEYFYADDGTLTGRAVNGKRVNFEYDLRGQLLAVKDAQGRDLERYTYDPAGNRLSKTVGGVTTTYVYDEANQLVSSTVKGVTTNYKYDAAGRLIKEGGKSYAYGWLNKVLSVTENGQQIASFNYHNDGQVAKAIYGGKVEEFLWDGLALIRRGETAYVNEPYVTGGNPVLADDDVLFNDMLGSTLSVNGNPVEMTSFGETADSNAFFTGKPYIGELGYAFLFRAYDPAQGKWTTSDPLGYPDGWNNLAYCGNYPGIIIDPNGAAWSWAAVGVGAALGALGYGVSCVISGENFSVSECIAAASGGAVAGAIAGAATGDVSALAIIGIAAGASAAGRLTENVVNETLSSISEDIQFNVNNLDSGVIQASAFGALGGAGSCVVKLKLGALLTPQSFDEFIAAIAGFSIEMSSAIYNELIRAKDAFEAWTQQLGQERIRKINEALYE